jgi:hypothetical protein
VDSCTQEDLARLPEEPRAALLGLAGLGLPVTNGHLAQVLAAAGMPQARAWAGNPADLQKRLQELRGLGLAQVDRTGHWSCAARAIEAAARAAFAQGLLGRLFQGALNGAGPGALGADPEARARAELRLAFLEGRHRQWLPLRTAYHRRFQDRLRGRDPLALICGGPFEPDWFTRLEPAASAYGCQALLQDAVLLGRPDPGFLAWIEAQAQRPRTTPCARSFLLYQLLQGRPVDTAAWAARQPQEERNAYAWPALEGLAAIAVGQAGAAVGHFATALARLGAAGGGAAPLPGLMEPLHILALLADPGQSARDLARTRLEPLARLPESNPLAAAAAALGRLALDRGAHWTGLRLPSPPEPFPPAIQFLDLLCAHLAGLPVSADHLEQVRQACAPLPLGWFSAALEELGHRLQGRPPRPAPLLDLMPALPSWERALNAMQRLDRL